MTSSPLQRTRAYAPIEGRQQRDDRLVASVAELRVMLEEAANAGAPLHVRLAADLEPESVITIPSEVPAFTLNGGGKYGAVYAANLPAVFSVEGTDNVVRISDASFRGNGTTTATAFVTTTATPANGVRLEGLEIVDTLDLFDPTASFNTPSVFRVAYSGVAAAIRATTGTLTGLTMVDVTGSFAFTLPASSGRARLVAVTSAAGIYNTSASFGSNVVVASVFGAWVSNATDAIIGGENLAAQQLQAQLFATPPRAPSPISGVDPTLFVTSSLVRFDASAASGNLSLSDGVVDGMRAVLLCTAIGAALTLPDNTANNVRLSAPWAVGQWDTLELVWDATDGNWIELGRSNN